VTAAPAGVGADAAVLAPAEQGTLTSMDAFRPEGGTWEYGDTSSDEESSGIGAFHPPGMPALPGRTSPPRVVALAARGGAEPRGGGGPRGGRAAASRLLVGGLLDDGPGPPRGVYAPLVSSTASRFWVARLDERAGRLTAKTGGFRPGQPRHPTATRAMRVLAAARP
jgi:hypothetical protein